MNWTIKVVLEDGNEQETADLFAALILSAAELAGLRIVMAVMPEECDDGETP